MGKAIKSSDAPVIRSEIFVLIRFQIKIRCIVGRDHFTIQSATFLKDLNGFPMESVTDFHSLYLIHAQSKHSNPISLSERVYRVNWKSNLSTTATIFHSNVVHLPVSWLCRVVPRRSNVALFRNCWEPVNRIIHAYWMNEVFFISLYSAISNKEGKSLPTKNLFIVLFWVSKNIGKFDRRVKVLSFILNGSSKLLNFCWPQYGLHKLLMLFCHLTRYSSIHSNIEQRHSLGPNGPGWCKDSRWNTYSALHSIRTFKGNFTILLTMRNAWVRKWWDVGRTLLQQGKWKSLLGPVRILGVENNYIRKMSVCET